MKVIINKTTNEIVEISPYSGITEKVTNWLEQKNYGIIDIDNPIASYDEVVEIIEPERIEIDGDGNEIIIPAVTETTQVPVFRDLTVDEIDEDRISSIKAKAGTLIDAQYPTYKQLNIIREDGANLITMTDFIDNIRTVSNNAETNGTLLTDVIW